MLAGSFIDHESVGKVQALKGAKHLTHELAVVLQSTEGLMLGDRSLMEAAHLQSLGMLKCFVPAQQPDQAHPDAPPSVIPRLTSGQVCAAWPVCVLQVESCTVLCICRLPRMVGPRLLQSPTICC